MGKDISKSYQEQEKAIKEKQISFNLNVYFIGDDISFIYQRFEKLKSNPNSGIFFYWNLFYQKGNYETQLKAMSDTFRKHLEKFEEDPKKNTFKELIIIKMKERNNDKIEEIFQIFASDKDDVYCPFIIFFFDKTGNEFEKVEPNKEVYYISPLKVFTFKYDFFESESIKEFLNCLIRICSYYNELGEQFFIWTKDSEKPIGYDLIRANFNSYINIFCLGRTGSGKSTFLNNFFKEKKSKQGGTGRSTTTKIVRFGINDCPIKIYDVPGFEDDKTIDKVNCKLIQTTSEMNTDKDKIHIILYFINNKEETMIYEMEKKIIDTLKKNNKDVRIIFVSTHSSIDPFLFQNGIPPKLKKKYDKIKEKTKKIIKAISSTFGEPYTYGQYFQEDSIIQKNLIFVNLEKDYENDIEPFGFDKVIQSIYNTIIEGNDLNQLAKVKEKLAHAIINKIQNNDDLNKEIEECLSKGYLLKHTTFAIHKEKAIMEAQKVYDGMFSFGKTLLTISPFFRDVKLGVIKFQKYQFKKELNRIFGFNIKSKNFDDNPNETEYEKINREFIEKVENKKDISKKEVVMNQIKKDYNENEVNSTWIISNEVIGAVSFAFLFGGPVLFSIGAIGVVGTSYISYNLFKKDCTEYFEQYKKHYEEYKYQSLYNFIISVLNGIVYMKEYIKDLNLNSKAVPSIENVKKIVKESIVIDFKIAIGSGKTLENEDEIINNIYYFN